jgi:hypothetical protein
LGDLILHMDVRSNDEDCMQTGFIIRGGYY